LSGTSKKSWGHWVMLAMGVAAFALVIQGTDVSATFDILAATGLLLPLALFPYLGQIGFDALSWRTLLAGLDRRVTWRRLLAVRLSTEAVLMSMPAGSIVGETLKPYLLVKTDKVPPADTIASIGVKKCLLVFAQATYLATALALGWGMLDAHSDKLIGREGAPALVVAAVIFLILVGAGLSLAFVGGAVSARIHRLLMRIPIARVRDWLAERQEPFAATDSSFRRLGRGSRARIFVAYVMLLGAWFVETLETWALLLILGLHLPLRDVLVMEAIAVLLRNLAFFVPAGLGVQDAGYLAFFHAFSLPAPLGAAFVILKRGKELCWVAIGYATLFFLQSRAASPRTPLLSATEIP
jgi:uncharacterized protein (TIRG00374 family)